MSKVSPSRAAVTRPVFLQFNGRRLFALQFVPTGTCCGALLYLPPFAEEMNRCRSHVVLQARALAAAGWSCLLLDPHGTGESDGQIVDADWDHWRADAVAAARWLMGQSGQPLTLWGLRTGALLAAEVATEMATPAQAGACGLLLWQPVLDGKRFLTQYLRLRIASQMMRDSERETVESIRARLSAGETIEVAGYPLTGRLADALATRHIANLSGLADLRIDWLEMVSKPGQPLSPASQRQADAWIAAGARVATATVADPMIWQLQERDDAPALQQASLALLGAAR